MTPKPIQMYSADTQKHTHPHTHLSWRRWVLPGARWGWLGSLHLPHPEEELSGGGQSACVGCGNRPRCGCQPRGELLNTDRDAQAADDIKTSCGVKGRACWFLGTCTFRGSRDRALALLKELGSKREPKTARTQDCQHDTHTQPCSHLKERENGERKKQTGKVWYKGIWGAFLSRVYPAQSTSPQTTT